MTAYRFRVKFEPDPTSLWRDIVVGGDQKIDAFQSAINPAFGLGQDHLWFVGTDEDYWDSEVKYQCPQEYGDTPSGGPLRINEEVYDAGETTIGEMTRQLGLEQYDRICYLYDYGDEWRFYAILKEVLTDEPSDKQPTVVKEKGDSIDQYDPPDEEAYSLPGPLQSVLPPTAVPTADLRDLEDRDDVVHVLVLLSIETGFGAVSERFAIQFEDAGYVLENYKPGWQVVRQVDGTNKTEKELLCDLADAVRDWHAEVAEMASAVTGQPADGETVQSLHVELNAELERIGYGELA